MKHRNTKWAFGLFSLCVLISSGAALAQDEGSGSEGSSDGLSVTELVLSKGLDSGTPVDPGTSFSRSDGRIYATVRLSNPTREATTIRVVFEKADGPARPTGGVELEVPGRPRYRTVARTGTGRTAGSYRCVVYSSEGEVLSTQEYQLTE